MAFIAAAFLGCGDEESDNVSAAGGEPANEMEATMPDAGSVADGTSCCQTGLGVPHGHEPDEVTDLDSCPFELPYATDLIDYSPGSGAGFGQSKLPDVVLGPPVPGPPTRGSLDVLSLGVNGEITLGFGDQVVIDGPGPDLIVWENPFWVGGDPENPFAELAEVSVSFDGEEWHTFPCDPQVEDGFDAGCAGWRTRGDFDVCTMPPLDPEVVGGDLFDLSELGVSQIRYVRIRDLAESGQTPSAGFDLDAVGAIHIE